MMFSMEITIYCYHDPVDRTQAKWNHRNGVEVGFALLLSETIVFSIVENGNPGEDDFKLWSTEVTGMGCNL